MTRPDITCEACHRRLAEGNAKTLRERYLIGRAATVARPLAQGHAMYWLTTKTLTSLCVAQERNGVPQ